MLTLSDYSTTRLVTHEPPTIETHPDDTFQTLLSLSIGEGRQGEGGLRTQGYFKRSLPDKPLITVVTVVYNGAAHLEETILSVIGQTYDNVEYIIIDGGSTDKTLDIIHRYEHAIDYWVSEKDGGIYDAWNKGVLLSLGKWISFLGADDCYLSKSLEKYSQLFYQKKDTEYISSKVNLVKNKKVIRTIGHEWNWSVFKKHMNVAHVGSLHSINIFKKNGLFNSNLKIVGDYDFLLQFKEKLNAAYLNEVTAFMRIGGASDSNHYVFIETAIVKKNHTNRSRIIIGYEMITSYLKWLIRRFFWY